MPDITPDIPGFADAQRRLRERFGRVVTFWTPEALGYDPSVPLDPESRAPFDPTIRPTAAASGVMASASAIASVVFQPLTATRRDETEQDQSGLRSRLNKDLILDVDDQALAEGASYYELDGERWLIVDVKSDGIGAKQRVIVFGQAET